MRALNFGLALLAVALIAAPSSAAIIAYEGFEDPTLYGGQVDAWNNAPLGGLDSTGTGFAGSWIPSSTSGLNGNADSRYQTGGLDYPASYQGTNVAVGGNGRVTGMSGGNASLRLNLNTTATDWVNTEDEVFISFLAQRVGDSVTDAGVIPDAARTQFNLASEYPRNFGARIMNTPTGNNALGTIGKPSDWNSNGVMYGDPNPVLVDTWGLGGWNDTHKVYSGADFADGVDHLVLSIDTATSTYNLQVNPQVNGDNDGELTWVHTDGDPVDFAMYAFGVSAGNDSSDRPVGDMEFDEILVATSFAEAAGFEQVPEPTSLVALCSLLGLGALGRRRS